ncbi:MAG: hypothetical protein A2729_05535 [Candidatus Buchananbacteria bacterium RIFCSPHIGHO2_01_FULL_39_14]|uniref:Glycosyl transferase family 28 C-terminal domain-containing protein n=1 Tax=Candidatus Buchananbacteria bacterium RIFCSPHIGHO2_01_FULL_39_14 TaxID=1797532 RepID=A0A1G1XXM7_9BACT|nr:MAG: hypothetical protein A2729_05535 [Candidatus Buchananbacteria bacterium RIFCSPHIGHO2_01_FULL_39_14]OGY49299.1 MAG: hypothetical protein A3D39_03910 [Candidatus Buchananbacteria bacterium RIFCSPHIGHO2_02_FULL_39_17]
MKPNHNHVKAWLISVDMGYGHQRAAFPLKFLAEKNQIISANNYPGISASDRKIWREAKKFYEFVSRFKKFPIIGPAVWELYDSLQEIPKFYPRRDLSKLSFQVKKIYELIEKKKWGKDLINKLAKKPLPLITTFFVPAFMAEVFNYPGEIYCLTTDADINRAWAPKNPTASRINYFAPNYRVVERLKLYGVQGKRIFLTGFPLPLENIGNLKLNLLNKDLVQRLVNLDPKKKYWSLYHGIIKKYLGISQLPKISNHLLTLTFAVGGAGAQKEIGAQALNSLRNEILTKKIRLVLVAGIHNSVSRYFRLAAKKAGLGHELERGVKIIFSNTRDDYFKKFNAALRQTDILWTKPSELSFYCALGIPIVMSPPIGSQEEFNRKWLRTIGAAVTQEDPRYVNQWLLDWINSGWFAEAAIQGYVEAPKLGTYNIDKIIGHKFRETKIPKMISQY